MYYSYNGNYPVKLEDIDRIRLSDGSTRTGGDYTDEELQDAGLTYVGDIPALETNQVLEWNAESLEWNVREKTKEELDAELAAEWQMVIDKKEQLLRDCDWTQLSDAFDGNIEGDYLREAWGSYRNTLRQINVVSNRSPQEVVWPEEPTDRNINIIRKLANGNQE